MAYWRTEEVHQTCLRLLKSGWLGHLLPMYFLFLYFSESCEKPEGGGEDTYVYESTHSDIF